MTKTRALLTILLATACACGGLLDAGSESGPSDTAVEQDASKITDGNSSADARILDGGPPEASLIDAQLDSSVEICGGSLVDLETDSQHCGWCFHDCLGAVCAAGLCTPTILVPDAGDVEAIAVDQNNVYWVGNQTGVVGKIPVDGGPAVILAEGQGGADGITVDSTSVYWTTFGAPGGTVMSVPIEGGTPKVLAIADSPFAIATNSRDAYFTAELPTGDTQGEVEKVSLDGGDPTVLWMTKVGALTRALAVDDSFVYAGCLDCSTSFVRMLLDGGDRIQFGLDGGNAVAVLRDATSIYWSEGRSILKSDLNGENQVVLATGQLNDAVIAIDSQRVYWGNYEYDGTIMSVALDGSGLRTLATGQGGANGVAVDSKYVYWGRNGQTYGDGAVVRVPK